MCGIWLRILRDIAGGPNCDGKETENAEELTHRGPDYTKYIQIKDIELKGYVLHLRGPEIVAQPYGSGDNWLLWNGELYDNNIFGGFSLDLSVNDTELLYNLFTTHGVLKVLSEIEACFAFIFLTKDEIWFGRDFLGRRSLIVSRSPGRYTISSLGSGTQLPPNGIFRIALATSSIDFFEWPHSALNLPSTLRFSTQHTKVQPFPDSLSLAVQKRLIGLGDIGILFSGGLDCSVLAALSHLHLPQSSTIFLLNVAFTPDAPDRLTALSSFQDLLHLSNRFTLILIDITQEQINIEKPRIVSLMGNNDSRMDFSIAAALYFASRGEGVDSNTGESVRFTGKILLSGMGADEIFGGYSRYKSSLEQYGEAGVVREIALDIDRLWHRNLGRDDRVVSCHSRELRFPYLDTALWQSLSIYQLFEVTEPQTPGREKFLLRDYARTLGLHNAAGFKKRAIQFGTRISQLCNLQDFGSNRKAKGWQSISKDKNSQIDEEVEFCCKSLENQLSNMTEAEQLKIFGLISSLKSEKTKTKEKRHIMRVNLGDYLSRISEKAQME